MNQAISGGTEFSRDFPRKGFYTAGMSMWILAIVLMLLFAAIGFAKGAIRASV